MLNPLRDINYECGLFRKLPSVCSCELSWRVTYKMHQRIVRVIRAQQYTKKVTGDCTARGALVSQQGEICVSPNFTSSYSYTHEHEYVGAPTGSLSKPSAVGRHVDKAWSVSMMWQYE